MPVNASLDIASTIFLIAEGVKGLLIIRRESLVVWALMRVADLARRSRTEMSATLFVSEVLSAEVKRDRRTSVALTVARHCWCSVLGAGGGAMMV